MDDENTISSDMRNNSLAAGKNFLHTHQKHFNTFSNKWFVWLLLLSMAAGCKKVTEQTGLLGVCPQVVSTTPADSALSVNLTTVITATFNEAIDTATLTAATFTVLQGTTPIAGIISYAGTTASFSPTTNLAPKTNYTVTISSAVRDHAHNAMISNYVWNFTTGPGPDLTPPVVIATDPINLATGILLNKKISVVFSKAMDSLSTTNSFSLVNTTLGGPAVAGSVTYSGTTAVFTPLVNLLPNTTYTGTVTKAAKDISGNTLVSNYVWSFTTAIGAPSIVSTNPYNTAINVPINKIITATFNEPINPLTIPGSFTVQTGTTSVAGTVTYVNNDVIFTPSVYLNTNTIYTATVKNTVKDLAGNALVKNYVFTFITVPPTVAPPSLGTASFFGAFSGNAGVTNQGLTTVINNGSVGSTASSALVTGFHEGVSGDTYTETDLNKGNVTGRVYAGPPAPGSTTSLVVATQALADATVAYNSISPAAKPGGTDPGAGELGGLTLGPGIYTSASGNFQITANNLVLDAKGDPNALWIFQSTGSLTVGIAGSVPRYVSLANGAQAQNVFWYVGTSATINSVGGGIMAGTIIASGNISISAPGNSVQTTLNGRAISLSGAITMVNTIINVQ